MAKKLWNWNLNRKTLSEDNKNTKIFKKMYLEVVKLTLSFLAFLSGLWKFFCWRLSNTGYWGILKVSPKATSLPQMNLKFQVVHEKCHYVQLSIQSWILTSTEAGLRLGHNFWVWYDPLVFREWLYKVWWSQLQKWVRYSKNMKGADLPVPPCR